jgi:hypothetical protein
MAAHYGASSNRTPAKSGDRKREAEIKIRNLEEGLYRVQGILAAHGLHTSAIAPSLVESDFPTKSSDLVNKFFSEAQHVRNTRDVPTRALARVAANRAPSRRGQQTKDCIVVESYLSLASLLRQNGFQRAIIFLTTNTKDYSAPQNNGSIHPELAGEFGAVGMEYAVNFRMAEYQLLQS